VSLRWLAEKLHLTSAANVSELLRRTAAARVQNERALPAELRTFLQKATEKPTS
jgi:hypothetical protein